MRWCQMFAVVLLLAGARAIGRAGGNQISAPPTLKLVLSCDRSQVREGDPVVLEAKLVNMSREEVSVFWRLLWNDGLGLSLHVLDSSGHTVEAQEHDDDMVIPSELKRPTSFIVLAPYHFLGVVRPDTTANLFRDQPGKYTVYAEYIAPVPGTYAPAPTFWSIDKGVLRSDTIQIEVLPRH